MDIPREELSEHLASRLEVEEELSEARCRFVGLRAAVRLDEALRRSLAAPDASRSLPERDPLAFMPGDPSWATNGDGQERVPEFKQG